MVPQYNLVPVRAYSDTEIVAGMVSPRHMTGIPVTFVDGHANFWKFPFAKNAFSFEFDDKY